MSGPYRVRFFGDTVGRPGREALARALAPLADEGAPDCVIANGENAAAGIGITRQACEELAAAGAQVVTTGNHAFAQREAWSVYDATDLRLIRPANFPPGVPGRGDVTFVSAGATVTVINLLGRISMEPVDCPFQVVDHVLKRLSAEGLALGPGHFVLVDFHAEATSEKMAMGWHLDGRVSALIGTHTHVPTADARVLPGGTGYITDAGMCGSFDSVIGIRRNVVETKFIQRLPVRFVPAEENPGCDVVLLELNPATGLCSAIRHRRILVPGASAKGKEDA